MNTRWKTSSIFAVALGAVLVVSSCGSDSDEEAASSSSPSPSLSLSPSPSFSDSSSTSPNAAESPAPSASVPAASPAPENSEAPAGPVDCSAAVLAGTVENTAGGGAAGSVYRTLVLTNSSAAPCTAAPGYPGVSYLDAAGRQVGAAAARTTNIAAGTEPIVLEPGQSAAAELRETRAQNYGEDCQAQPVTQLLVYPPDDLAALTVAHDALGCTNPDIELLSVGPLQKR